MMKNPTDLLPLKFGNSFCIRCLDWSDFPGVVDEKLPYSAHIFWSIQYKIIDIQKSKLSVSLIINKRSWVRPQRKSQHLLNHQQGHYLIGSLCILQFLRRVDYKKKKTQEKFQDLVTQTFQRTLKQYIEIEKIYDIQTEHRLNFKMQQKWDNYLYQKLQFYKQIYDKKKNKFVKFSQSPNKTK